MPAKLDVFANRPTTDTGKGDGQSY